MAELFLNSYSQNRGLFLSGSNSVYGNDINRQPVDLIVNGVIRRISSLQTKYLTDD